jgi:hypothetical protein
MSTIFQDNSMGFGKAARLGRKALCATLSFAVLNASLAPVMAMSGSTQGYEGVVLGDTPESKKHPQAPKAPDRGKVQVVFEEGFEEAVSLQATASKAAVPMGYGAWMLKGLESGAGLVFAGSKGLLGLVSRGVSYSLKNPGEALVAGLATQIAAIHAIRPLTDEFRINQNTTGAQQLLSVTALSNSNIFVAWAGNQAGNADIYGRVIAPNGMALISEFLINQNTTGNQLYPSVTALSNGNVYVAW